MANSEAELCSDAAQISGSRYQVFLSFRGPDTRHEFTDFLYNNLVDAGVCVFRDNNELPFGGVIGVNLPKAIDESTIYIPIFSQTYASSIWCLRELAHMVGNVSKSEGKKIILPIFFHVQPEDVKLRTSLYSNALLGHKKKFSDEVEKWREALKEVGKIRGWNVEKDQSKDKIVKLVVKEVLEKLKLKQKSVTKHLIGHEDRVKDLMKLLDVKQDDVRLIGIYGMGGIGKTTIAKVIFNQLSSHFGKDSSFLKDVRERSAKDGIVQLQKKLLCDVCSSHVGEIEDSEQGKRRIGEILRNKMVLLVLDDVSEKEHIEKLIGNNTLYSGGSRIIITTRNKTSMQIEGFKGETLPYEMLKMDDCHARDLFYRHAFGGDLPSGDYLRLSTEIVSHAGGLPLSITVIGASLRGKDEDLWKETLVKLTKVPEKKVLDKLRICFDDLEAYQQQIFLDIACFFFNENKTDAFYIWTELCPIKGIEVLINRCLIKILDNDKLWMHNQLMKLGWQMVHEERPSDLRKQSRLRIAKENLEIITTNERKDKVRALQIDGPDDPIKITNEELERFRNLRFLELRNGTFVGDFTKCHSKLRWISWQPPFREFRATNMYLKHLVAFKLGKNKFKDNSKAWDLIKEAKGLKVLSLAECDDITTNPNFSKCSGLERLTLQRCNKLERIETFIGHLQTLIMLEIEWCLCLTKLPREVGRLVKLKRFSLRGCRQLKELPDSLGNLTSLIELDLSGTGIAELPNSIKGLVKLESFLLTGTMIRELPNFIGKLKSLRILGLSKDGSWYLDGSHSPKVWQLPNSINMLENLEELDLSKRDEMKGEIPIEIGDLSSLRILNLEETCVSRIPFTINKLHHLQTLNLLGCHDIQELPELPTSLTCLRLKSNSLRSVPNLSNLTNLVELGLSDGSSFTNKSNWITGCSLSWIGRLSGLKKLELDLLNVCAPLELASLSHLEELTLGDLDLKTLEQLPSSLLSLELQFCSIRWAELTTLLFGYSEGEDIPLDRLPQLENLTVYGCKLLQRLSIPPALRKLRQVIVSSCPKLVEIQIAGPSKSLESFVVYKCESLKRIGGLSYLMNVKKLEIMSCNALTSVEGLNELESLKSLKVIECKSLESLIDASCAIIPDDCLLHISRRGEIMDSPSKNPFGISLKYYREEILLNTSHTEVTSNKMEHPFMIDFFLIIKHFGGMFSATWRKQKYVTPDSVTYERLIADVKGFGFLSKRMRYIIPGEDRASLIEIKRDEQVEGMVQLASERRIIRLVIEGGFDISLEGAITWASQWRCTIQILAFFLCVAVFLFLSFLLGRVDFPKKIRQLAGMRGFNLCEDFAVISFLLYFLFTRFK